MITRTEATKCLNCGKDLDAIGDVDDAPDCRGPRPGDPIACLRCGAVCTVDERGNLQPFTGQQARELMRDQEAMRELRMAIGRIHAINVMVN